MDLPLKQGPKGEVKSEEEAVGTAATSSSSEEQTALVDGEPCSASSVVCKVDYSKHCLNPLLCFDIYL